MSVKVEDTENVVVSSRQPEPAGKPSAKSLSAWNDVMSSKRADGGAPVRKSVGKSDKPPVGGAGDRSTDVRSVPDNSSSVTVEPARLEALYDRMPVDPMGDIDAIHTDVSGRVAKAATDAANEAIKERHELRDKGSSVKPMYNDVTALGELIRIRDYANEFGDRAGDVANIDKVKEDIDKLLANPDSSLEKVIETARQEALDKRGGADKVADEYVDFLANERTGDYLTRLSTDEREQFVTQHTLAAEYVKPGTGAKAQQAIAENLVGDDPQQLLGRLEQGDVESGVLNTLQAALGEARFDLGGVLANMGNSLKGLKVEQLKNISSSVADQLQQGKDATAILEMAEGGKLGLSEAERNAAKGFLRTGVAGDLGGALAGVIAVASFGAKFGQGRSVLSGDGQDQPGDVLVATADVMSSIGAAPQYKAAYDLLRDGSNRATSFLRTTPLTQGQAQNVAEALDRISEEDSSVSSGLTEQIELVNQGLREEIGTGRAQAIAKALDEMKRDNPQRSLFGEDGLIRTLSKNLREHPEMFRIGEGETVSNDQILTDTGQFVKEMAADRLEEAKQATTDAEAAAREARTKAQTAQMQVDTTDGVLHNLQGDSDQTSSAVNQLQSEADRLKVEAARADKAVDEARADERVLELRLKIRESEVDVGFTPLKDKAARIAEAEEVAAAAKEDAEAAVRDAHAAQEELRSIEDRLKKGEIDKQQAVEARNQAVGDEKRAWEAQSRAQQRYERALAGVSESEVEKNLRAELPDLKTRLEAAEAGPSGEGVDPELAADINQARDQAGEVATQEIAEVPQLEGELPGAGENPMSQAQQLQGEATTLTNVTGNTGEGASLEQNAAKALQTRRIFAGLGLAGGVGNILYAAAVGKKGAEETDPHIANLNKAQSAAFAVQGAADITGGVASFFTTAAAATVGTAASVVSMALAGVGAGLLGASWAAEDARIREEGTELLTNNVGNEDYSPKKGA